MSPQEEGIKLTPTILVGKAVGAALAVRLFALSQRAALLTSLQVVPHSVGRVVMGRFVPREQIDVCFLVAVPESKARLPSRARSAS